MKCPHCGMNLRDDITECGYCGGKVAQKKERAPSDAGRFTIPRGGQKASPASAPHSGDPDADEEEEGGLSAILQPGEQVLIGSLNVAVKKFSFHAYLTNQRIFLVDTQEKKLKVTAKDVPRDTIAGSIVEFSESSDPVLVLSIKSGDDDVKTMKLVFVQSGTDRSDEIDEWINLLQEGEAAPAKKAKKKPAAPARQPEPEEEPEEEVPVRKPQKRPVAAAAKVQEPIVEEEYAEEEAEEPEPIRVPERARPRHELQPAKRPVKKDHERQPPVKRLHSLYREPEEETVPEEEPLPEPAVVIPPKRVPVKQVIATSYEREVPQQPAEPEPVVRKQDVQSAMRVAMNSAIRQTGPVASRPVRKTVIEPAPAPFREEEPAPVSSRRPVVQESRQVPVQEKPEPGEVKEATPQFCHNCGKKLPHSANFCPGCGTKLNTGRTLPHSRTSPTLSKKMTRTDPPGHEQRPAAPSPAEDEEIEEEKPVPTRPPVRKAPKGSEMTILHKFLRR